MPRYHATANGNVQFTAEEEAQWDKLQADAITNRPSRKLAEIKEIRLQKLIETDYLANSDITMPDNIKTWRQSLRDIPANHTDEDAYDLLLTRETDKSKNNYGQLTHSIWEKP